MEPSPWDRQYCSHPSYRFPHLLNLLGNTLTEEGRDLSPGMLEPVKLVVKINHHHIHTPKLARTSPKQVFQRYCLKNYLLKKRDSPEGLTVTSGITDNICRCFCCFQSQKLLENLQYIEQTLKPRRNISKGRLCEGDRWTQYLCSLQQPKSIR